MFQLDCLEAVVTVGIAGVAIAAEPAAKAGGPAIGVGTVLAHLGDGGADRSRLLDRMRDTLAEELDGTGQTPPGRAAAQRADAAMAELLPRVALRRSWLAQLAPSGGSDSFPQDAARIVLAELGALDPRFAAEGGDPEMRDFALRVLSRAFETALREGDYVRLVARLLDAGRSSQEIRTAALLAAVAPEAARLGVGEQALGELARRIARADGHLQEGRREMRRALDEFVLLRDRARALRSPRDPVEGALKRMAALNEEGRFDEASAEAERAFASLQDPSRKAAAARLRTIDLAIEQSCIGRNADAMARWIAERIAAESGTLTASALVREVQACHRRALKFGLGLDLDVAIALAWRAVSLARTDLERGNALNALGIATADQGERTPGHAGAQLLGDAVGAYRGALAICAQLRLWVNWATTQNNLGAALAAQGERTAGETGAWLMGEAVAAYRDALAVHSEQDLPIEWANTQHNLGRALATHGALTGGPVGIELLGQAIAAFRAALRVRSEKALRAQWRETQAELAGALRAQGELIEGEAGEWLLGEAVAAARTALATLADTDSPVLWAKGQCCLAMALASKGARVQGENGARLLHEAVGAYQAALGVLSETDLPGQWGTAQAGLGAAHECLAALDPQHRRDHLLQAEVALRLAQRVGGVDLPPDRHARVAEALERVRGELAAFA